MDEGNRSLIVTQPTTQEELFEAQAQRLAVGKPPTDRFALSLHAIAS
jgi:hypothetical protein